MGTFGTPETRKLEAEITSKILGITYREQLGLADGSIENNEASRFILIEAIRKYQPEIVLANAIHDRHPDHANAAKLFSDEAFLSGLKNKETVHSGIIQEPWRPKAVYNYIQDYFLEPDFVIDISSEMDKKTEAIKAFQSQFVKPKENEPRSILDLLNQIKSTNSIYGRPINAKYAKGFTVNKYIGIHDFFLLR